MGIDTGAYCYAQCDGPGCETEGPITYGGAARTLDAALHDGWRQIETATGSKLLCPVCGAKHHLPALNAALDKPGPVQDAVLSGLGKDLAGLAKKAEVRK